MQPSKASLTARLLVPLPQRGHPAHLEGLPHQRPRCVALGAAGVQPHVSEAATGQALLHGTPAAALLSLQLA